MRYILIFLLTISLGAAGQYSPTSAKTKFVNGIAIGSKDTTSFNAADSMVLTIGRDSVLYWRYKGKWRAVANDVSGVYVPYTGAVSNVNLGAFRLTARSLRMDSLYANSSAGGMGVTNSGTKVFSWGAGGSNEASFHGFAGYDANRSSSYTVRSFTDKGYVDSLAALKYGGSGTTNTIPKFTSASVLGNSNVSDIGTLITLNSNSRINGNVAISAPPNSATTLRVSKTITGGLSSQGVLQDGTVQSDVTTNAYGFINASATAAEVFTLGQYVHYGTLQNTFGAGSTVTTQVGFNAHPALVGATNNYGFRGQIANGTGRFNLYMDGSASNYIQSELNIGTPVTDGANKLRVIGAAIITGGISTNRIGATSLILNKDSVPITTSNVWSTTIDTDNGSINRRNLSNLLTSSITFDTTTRVLSIPTLSGGSSSVVIPRGAASGTSGITTLSSSRTGNLVTVSGDNGSTTTFSIRDADSTTRANLIAGNGLSGSNYNGVSAVTWTADTTVLSTKNNVDARLLGFVDLSSNQTIGGLKTFSSEVSAPSLNITSTADSSVIFKYPAELKTLYRENTLYPKNFGFNIVNTQSNSFFTFTEEGLAHQAYYKGDGDGNTNIWGVSSKLNTDTGWIPRAVINQNGRIGFGTNTPLSDVDIRGEALVSLGVTAKRFNGTSLVLNKDSVPITTSNTWGLFIDTTSGRIQRRNISNSFVDLSTAQTIGGAKSFTSTLSAPKIVGGSTPTTVAGGAETYIGAGAVASVSGNDIAGQVTLTTGTGCGSTGASNRNAFTVTFSSAYANQPIVLINAIQRGGLTSTDAPTQLFFLRRSNSGTGSFTVYIPLGTTLPDNTTYDIFYHVIGR